MFGWNGGLSATPNSAARLPRCLCLVHRVGRKAVAALTGGLYLGAGEKPAGAVHRQGLFGTNGSGHRLACMPGAAGSASQ